MADQGWDRATVLPSRRGLLPGLHSGPQLDSRLLFPFAQRNPLPQGSSQRRCAAKERPWILNDARSKCSRGWGLRWESCADPVRGGKGRARTLLPSIGRNTQHLKGPWTKNGFGFSQQGERNLPVLSIFRSCWLRPLGPPMWLSTGSLM